LPLPFLLVKIGLSKILVKNRPKRGKKCQLHTNQVTSNVKENTASEVVWQPKMVANLSTEDALKVENVFLHNSKYLRF
jgi:hypothetical protein